MTPTCEAAVGGATPTTQTNLGADSILENPCVQIDKLLEKTQKQEEGVITKSNIVGKYFSAFVKAHGSRIPTLHAGTSESLKPKGLTRVVAMVQDLPESEYFYGVYKVVDVATKEVKRTCSALYREPSHIGEGETVEPVQKGLSSRQPVYTVAVPAESPWVPATSSGARTPHGLKSPLDCIVKLYNGDEANVKVNSIYEFVGVWEPPKATSCANSPHILHAVWFQPVDESYPLVANGPKSALQNESWLKEEAGRARSEVLTFLDEALGGDAILAEYLLLHSLSSIISRQNSILVGSFSLNLSGFPPSPAEEKLSFAARIRDALSVILPRVRLFDMSLKNCNKERWVSVQDHEKDRLSLGKLQIPEHTTLVFNETAMENGTLEALGVLNVRDLGLLVKDQAVSFDYEYHGLPFKTNAQILLLSEGKSIVKADVQLQMQPQDGAAASTPAGGPVDEESAAVQALLDGVMGGGKEQAPQASVAELARRAEGKLDSWRRYILLCRALSKDVKLDEETQRFASVDWVAMRKRDKNVTQNTLHFRMTLARALTVSFGEKVVTVERYNEMRNLEEQRMSRIK